MKNFRNFSEIFDYLARPGKYISHLDASQKRLADKIHLFVKKTSLKKSGNGIIEMGPFGRIRMPYTKMGAVTSLDLFGLDELLLFHFYWENRHRYTNVIDIGANIGLHSILMARCGWKVTSFEPDSRHCRLLRRNLKINGIQSVTVREAAVSKCNGRGEFVNVVGNTTSSHLAGAKTGAYGKLKKVSVRLVSAAKAMKSADFVKIDAEGHEWEILKSMPEANWGKICCVIEVGSEENAKHIYNFCKKKKIPFFPQKKLWKKGQTLRDMPKNYKEGSVFLARREPSLR